MNRELTQRVSAAAFEERYAKSPDPWDFATSKYENDRYQTILQTFSASRYGAVYEPGCSVGVLTAQLAAIADRVIATEVSPSAVRQAQARCQDLGNVDILCENAALYVPPIPLNLIVFSEIGYYFEPDELARIAGTLAAQVEPQGEFVAVHWLGESEDHVLHGDVVHETLLRQLPLTWRRSERHEHFRIDTWVKT